ncbi:tail sheath monomer [Synechococcus phage S-H9-2]|uniref:Tail sheath monomer n=1 Tax=Synechococcus phage S-H9-2 TaxID=2783669 RepID=A0A873WJR9_9CAUD|nr:tail sheath [Synechococcus phage S-H9-2]QPB08315.1 tail sheath monomer [Synechococcus phage S-H9-2]
MASQVSPGILIKERDLTNAVVTGALAIRAAHASSFAKGPIGEIVNINTQKELIDTFGEPTEDYAEDWMVASEFLNYGGRLAVVRAESTGALNATTGGSGVLIKNEEDWMAGTGTTNVFAARSAGTHGNRLVGVLVDHGADYILTLASAPANVTIAAGDSLAFSGGVTATVISGDEDALVVKADGAITTSSTLTDGGATVAVSNAKDWYLNTTVEGVALSAIGPRPGSTQFALDNSFTNDAVHFAVIDRVDGVLVERFTYLSKLSDARDEEGGNIYYKSVINEQSAYLFQGSAPATDANLGGTVAVGTASTGTAGAFLQFGAFNDRLEDGADGAGYTAGQWSNAMDLFLDTEETDIDFVLMGGSMTSETDTKAKATKAIAIAASRKDAIAFVSPHKGNQVASTGGALTSTQQKENTLNFFSDLTSTSYAVFDSGYKYVYDRFNDKYRYIPCNGDVAGLCVQTSNLQEDWYSPAGLNRGGILNAVKMAYNPNKADRDELYQNRINPVVGLRGQGITLFGDKTALSAPSAFDRINVRRLFLNLEKRARRLAEGVLFEQNDATTRAGFASALNSYLTEVQARRGVTDYLVICDESNNTPDVIDRNEFVAEVYVKPTRSINYITVTFTATKTGVSFSEVVGR